MNSLAGHLNLLGQCHCENIISARGININDILSSHPMRHIAMPELNELLSEEVVPHFPYEKTFEQAKLHPYLVLHTSGSTGLPKPIVFNHAFISAVDATLNLIPEASKGRAILRKSIEHAEPVRIFSPFAPFHVISATQMMAWTVFGNAIYVFGPANRMTTPGEALDIFKYANVDRAWCSPAMLEAFATMPSAMESLRSLSMVMYGGGECTNIFSRRADSIVLGALSQSSGSKISKVTRLVNTWGTSENAMPVQFETDPEDWAYIAFEPDLNGFEWRVAGENQFELVIVRRPEQLHLQPTFAIFPNLAEWPTRDIWTPHPQKANHWRYVGRTDDLICYADGLKYHPAAEETDLCENPLIQSALMVGNQRTQSALLLELRHVASPQTKEEREKLMDKVWPTITKANALAPSVAQIAKSHVILATPEKPFVRAGKDTVLRGRTIELYKEDIDQLYVRAGEKGMPLLPRAQG